MKNSIVITTYNNHKKCLRLIDSIIKQTIKPDLVIIIDDNSQDGYEIFSQVSKEIFSKNSIKLIIEKNSENFGGPALGRNKGIRYSLMNNIDYIHFVDADDVWDEKKIEITNNIIKKNNLLENECIISTKYDLLNSNIKIIKQKIEIEKLTIKNFSKGNPIALSSVCISNKLLRNIKFNTRKEFIAIEDYELYLNTLKNKKDIFRIDQILVYIDKNNNSLSSNKYKMLRKFIKIQNIYFPKNKLSNTINWIINRIVKYLFIRWNIQK